MCVKWLSTESMAKMTRYQSLQIITQHSEVNTWLGVTGGLRQEAGY